MRLRAVGFISPSTWHLRVPRHPKRKFHQSGKTSNRQIVCIAQKPSTRFARLSNNHDNIPPAPKVAQQLVDAGVVDAEDAKILNTYSDTRATLFAKVLSNRTRHVTFVLDGVHGAHNLAAIARSCDAWGVQDLHFIAQPEEYRHSLEKQRVSKYNSIIERFEKEQSVGNVSKNSHKWLTIREHNDVSECVKHLREAGYKIVVSSLSPTAVPVQEVDTSSKCAFVFGNERCGVTEEMEKSADMLFTIPMMGFVESMNVSVAVATTASLTISACKHHTPARQYFLTPEEKRGLAKEWLMERYRSKGNPKPLQRREDVTRLGSEGERKVVTEGMFAALNENEIEPTDYWKTKIRLSGNGGVRLATYVSRRKFGSLGDRKFEKRCESLKFSLAGAHALSCEAALQATENATISRQRLCSYFKQLCNNISALYRPYFDAHGSPLLPIHAPESHAKFADLQLESQYCVLPICVQVAREWMNLSEPEVHKAIRESDYRTLSRVIAQTIRFSPARTSAFCEIVHNSYHLKSEVKEIVKERDVDRELSGLTPSNFNEAQQERSHTQIETQEQLLHIFIRLAHCGFLCSELHQTAWEKESSGRTSNRLTTLRYALIESILSESYSEMIMLNSSQEKAFLRLIVEMEDILHSLNLMIDSQ